MFKGSNVALMTPFKDESLDVHKFKGGRLMATFARKGSEFWRGKAANIEFDGGKAAIRNKSQFAALTFELELKTPLVKLFQSLNLKASLSFHIAESFRRSISRRDIGSLPD